jgi:rhodanese-related sulfurtransferase
MTPDELALRIIDNDKNLQIIDVRSEEEYKKFSLPKSHLIYQKDLFGKEAEKLLTVNHMQNVFIANDELQERKAAIIANKLGYNEITILKGGLKRFHEEILNFKMPGEINTRDELYTYRFRLKASRVLPELIEQNKNKIIPKKESKRVIGGC